MTWRQVRDACLFFAGLAGLGYETLGGHAPRESLLVIFAAMMGLPAFLRADEKKGPDRDDQARKEPIVTESDRQLADHMIALLSELNDRAKSVAARTALYPRTALYGITAVLVALGASG